MQLAKMSKVTIFSDGRSIERVVEKMVAWGAHQLSLLRCSLIEKNSTEAASDVTPVILEAIVDASQVGGLVSKIRGHAAEIDGMSVAVSEVFVASGSQARLENARHTTLYDLLGNNLIST